MNAYDRFTEPAKAALAVAQEQAQASSARFIGTEHVLLGLMVADHGVAAQVLGELGIDVRAVRTAIATVSGRTQDLGIGAAAPTPQVRRVIELAFEEARDQGSGSVGTEHLLLGLLLQADGTGGRALVHLGAPLGRVRDAVVALAQRGVAEA